jgi:hypothetical protein
MDNIPWRSVDLFGEDTQDTANGSLRNRRRDRPSISLNGWDEDKGSSSRNSPHPLLPGPSSSRGTPEQRERGGALGNGLSATNFDEISRPSLFRLTSDLEREVHAVNVISRSSVDDTSLRGSSDIRRSGSVREPPKEVEVIVHGVRTSISHHPSC